MEILYIIGGMVTVFKFIEYIVKFIKWLKGRNIKVDDEDYSGSDILKHRRKYID